MHEKAKFEESKYFLSQMELVVEDSDAFKHNLSAFLSSSRSVLQYALEEAKLRPNGRAWYDSQVAGHAVLSFFKDKRNLNIHSRPIEARKTVQIESVAHVCISESLELTLTRQDGSVESETIVAGSNNPPIYSEGTTTVLYHFSDWSGSEDVLTLAKMYLEALDKFLQDGSSSGFIPA